MAFSKKEINAALKSRAGRVAKQSQEIIEPEIVEDRTPADTGATPKKRRSVVRRSLVFAARFAVILMIIWYFFGGGLENQAGDSLKLLQDKVASDYVQQYEMAKRNGSPMDVCVLAGFVSAAYLQAKDEPNYAKWKQIERTDCAKAGVSR
jgi:hypothetical protein